MAPSWWAKGLLFENCNCQLLCPAHVSFRHLCTNERCFGHWALHFDEGRSGEADFAGLNALVLFNAPQQMFSGSWTQALYLDERAGPAERRELEALLKGQLGGPWAVLARFVGTWLETSTAPIGFEDAGRAKRMWIDGVFDTRVEAVRGQDPEREVLLLNIFNQIHGSEQVLARGTTRAREASVPVEMEGTHGLYSRFSWSS